MSKAKTPAKKKRTTVRKTTAKSTAPVRIPQPHGGALNSGGTPGNPGGGRPPDEIRAKLRELGVSKGVPFLSDVLDGKIAFTLVGKCSECGKESTPTDSLWLKNLYDQVAASVDQRLKANEQAFKYGLGTKDEIDVTGTIQRAQDAMAQALAENVAPAVQQRILERMAELVRG